jgi:hypothetical protein
MTRYALAESSTAGDARFVLRSADKSEEISLARHYFQRKLDLNSRPSGSLSIANKGTGTLYARLIMCGKPVEYEVPDVSSNLIMEVGYEAMDGRKLDVGSLPQGLDFKAVVRVRNPGLLGSYSELALAQVFPSGWEIINTRLGETEAEDGKYARIEYTDIRDDRVYSFFDLNNYGSIEVVVLLNAAYAGRYYLPPVSCGAMYNHSISATVKGRWVEVRPTGTAP